MKAKKKLRVPLNRRVKPKTVVRVKRLAKLMDISEGKVIDRAVEVLAEIERPRRSDK